MFHMIVNANSVVQLVIQIRNGIMINVYTSVKKCKKDYSWNPSACVCEKSKYLKRIVDDSVIVCDYILNVTDSVSINVTNAISRNVTSTI